MTAFSTLIPSWPQDGATDVAALLRRSEDDPGSLSPAERTVVGWLHEAGRVGGQRPITGPLVVRDLLTFPDGKAKRAGTLRVPDGKWVSIPLDENYHRVLDRNRDGTGSHWATYVTAGPPTCDDLPDAPSGGRYVIIAGGRPEAMVDTAGASTLGTLCRARPVSDVLFWDAAGRKPTMWSLKLKSGCTFAAGSWTAEPISPACPPETMEVELA